MTRPIPKQRRSVSIDPKRIRSSFYFGRYMIARLWDNSGVWRTQCGSTS
jgi:hypothetical protein